MYNVSAFDSFLYSHITLLYLKEKKKQWKWLLSGVSKTQLVTLIYGPFQQRTTQRLENKGPCKQVTKNFKKVQQALNSFKAR